MTTALQETMGEKLERLRAALTLEQRTFCEKYLATMEPVESYQAAFKCLRASAVNRCYALLEKWYIRDYLAALMEVEDPTDALLTKAELLVTLRTLIRDEGVRPGTKVRAVEVALKAIGIGDTTTHRHTGPDGKSPPVFLGFTVAHVHQVRTQILGFDIPDGPGDDGTSASTDSRPVKPSSQTLIASGGGSVLALSEDTETSDDGET